jgi:outer membrane protein assembly factor BamB
MIRMRILSVLGLLGLAALAVAADVRPSDDWPIFRGNALQNGVAATTLSNPLKLRWKYRARDGVEATAAIAHGVAYVADLDGNLAALGLADGKPKWTYHAGSFKAPPSVADGRVYVGDSDGVFHCLDAATGKQLWTFQSGADISSGANFAKDAVLFGSSDQTLYCVSKEGKPRWQFKIEGGPVLGSPAVIGDRTFASGCDSTLHVLDTATGKELSATELGGQVGATAALAGDRLYVGTMTKQVLAVDWKKGDIAWKFEAPKSPNDFYASVAVTDNLVIAGSRDRKVYGLDRRTGQEVWSFRTGRQVDSSPVVDGGRVYIGSGDGKLYVLDLAKGTEVNRYDLGGQVIASPAVGEHCLVIGTTNGDVYCFE